MTDRAVHLPVRVRPCHSSDCRSVLQRASGRAFYNTSRLDFGRLLDDPNNLAQNLNSYIRDFSPNVREIMDRFAFTEQIARMEEKYLLFQVVPVAVGNDHVEILKAASAFFARELDPRLPK